MQGIDLKNLNDHTGFHLDTSLGGSDELLQLSTFKCQFIKDLNSSKSFKVHICTIALANGFLFSPSRKPIPHTLYICEYFLYHLIVCI
jgi:hypothetical protein